MFILNNKPVECVRSQLRASHTAAGHEVSAYSHTVQVVHLTEASVRNQVRAEGG